MVRQWRAQPVRKDMARVREAVEEDDELLLLHLSRSGEVVELDVLMDEEKVMTKLANRRFILLKRPKIVLC